MVKTTRHLPCSRRGAKLFRLESALLVCQLILFMSAGLVCDTQDDILLLEISKDEVLKIVQGFADESLLTSGGVTIAGNRYIYLSGTDRIIRAKLGKVGVHCMKTTQAVVISLYEEPIQPQQAASVVEKLGDYLITCGY